MKIQEEISRRFALQEEFLGYEKPVNRLEPLVSISVAAYNHEKYIRQCLDGILMQKTTFKFELIIGEDDSTDKTREICKDYAIKHQDKIRLFLRDREISHLKDEKGKLIKRLNGVLGFGRMSSKGKYIALCEGDDYWTDPLKLQKQVDLMEADEDCKICYHRVDVDLNGKILSDENDITEKRYKYILDKNNLNIMTLLEHGNFIHTCSVVFRREDYKPSFEMTKSPVGDYLLYISLIKNKGTIRKINESMAVYRRGVGIYSSLSSYLMLQNIVKYQMCVLAMLDKPIEKELFLIKGFESIKKFDNTAKEYYLSEENILDNIPFKKILSLLYKKIKTKILKR